MQNYTTIIGIIELRLQKVGYETTQKRYGVGSSTVTLILKRFQELGIPLEELKAMSPKDVEKAFYPPENLSRTTQNPRPYGGHGAPKFGLPVAGVLASGVRDHKMSGETNQ